MHKLPLSDQQLFESMAVQYQSANEKIFFETIESREQWDYTVAHDFLLLQSDNEDNIFLLRVNYKRNQDFV